MNRNLIIILLIFGYLAATAQGERKFQLWNNSSVTVHLFGKSKLQVAEKLHYTPSSNSFDVKFSDIWIKNRVTEWFEFGSGIRFASIKKELDFIPEKRLMVNGTLEKELRGIDFKYSNRMEYRMFREEQNHFRNVGMMTISFLKINPLKIRFFLSEEMFFKLNSDRIHLMRFYAGINTFEHNNINLNLYYALEKNKQVNSWNNVDVIGLNINVAL